VNSIIWEFLKDWLTINGVRAYTASRRRAMDEHICLSLPEFLFIRLFATKLGQMSGAVVGLAASRIPSWGSVKDAHVR
jgi:hypothetical protein